MCTFARVHRDNWRSVVRADLTSTFGMLMLDANAIKEL